MSDTIRIDDLEPLECGSSALEQYSNDFRAIRDLWYGLEWLRFYVDELEKAERLDPMEELSGRPVRLPFVDPRPPVGSCFDWYAVSACNLVSLIGWIAQKCGATTDSPDAYLKRVTPDVLVYRNKIAAHTSRVKPRGPRGVEDGLAIQEISTMRLFSKVNGRYTANAMRLFRRSGGVASSSEELRPWALVDMQSELRRRYQPLLGKLLSRDEMSR